MFPSSAFLVERWCLDLFLIKLDIMLTTANVVPLQPDVQTLNQVALLFLWCIFQFHKESYISFCMEEISSNFPKTGWSDKLTRGKGNYKNSEVYASRGVKGLPHANTQLFLHSSSDSEEGSDKNKSGTKRSLSDEQTTSATPSKMVKT